MKVIEVVAENERNQSSMRNPQLVLVFNLNLRLRHCLYHLQSRIRGQVPPQDHIKSIFSSPSVHLFKSTSSRLHHLINLITNPTQTPDLLSVSCHNDPVCTPPLLSTVARGILVSSGKTLGLLLMPVLLRAASQEARVKPAQHP